MSPAMKTSERSLIMRAIQVFTSLTALTTLIYHIYHHIRNPFITLNSEADYIKAVNRDDIPQMRRMEDFIIDEEHSIRHEESKNVVDRTGQEGREDKVIDMPSEEISVDGISRIADECQCRIAVARRTPHRWFKSNTATLKAQTEVASLKDKLAGKQRSLLTHLENLKKRRQGLKAEQTGTAGPSTG